MKLITITPRVKDRFCRKCKEEMHDGDQAMVQRNQSGRHYCMECWTKMCM